MDSLQIWSIFNYFHLKIQNEYELNMRLLVTGGCGFIGSNFIRYYFSQSPPEYLVNLDAMYYCAKETNIPDAIRNAPNYSFIRGSCSNYDLVKHILVKYKITHIIHFAA